MHAVSSRAGGFPWCRSSSQSRCLRRRESSRVVSRRGGRLLLVWTRGVASRCSASGSAVPRIPSLTWWALFSHCMSCSSSTCVIARNS